MIHRDIKPANLYICRRGLEYDFVKVLDFGLVKSEGMSEKGRSQLTVQGFTSGTPAFMAPEMVSGESKIDGRADLYALGCVAYWLLSGRLVFEGKSAMSILLQHAKEAPPALSASTEIEIPGELEQVVLECLAKSPDERPQSASDLSGRLGELELGLRPWTQERAERWWSAHLPQLVATATDAGEGPPAVIPT
jgi:serine/threonine-protein kinase